MVDNTGPVPEPKGATRLTTASKGRQPVFLRHIVVTLFFMNQKGGWKQLATGGYSLKACFQLSRNRVDPPFRSARPVFQSQLDSCNAWPWVWLGGLEMFL